MLSFTSILKQLLCSKIVRFAGLIAGGLHQSDKFSYSIYKDSQTCGNQTFTAAASRAASRIALQHVQDKAPYILYSSPGT